MIYSANYWALTKELERNFKEMYPEFLRRVQIIYRGEELLPNSVVLQRIPPLTDTIKTRRLKLIGYCWRSKYGILGRYGYGNTTIEENREH